MFSKITKASLGLCFALGMLFPALQAQTVIVPTDDQFIKEKDKDEHQKWRKGESQFPGKPRDMWQLGLGGGSFLISGDVKPQFGWGTSIHLRKSLGYILSLKGEYMFGQARGLNYQGSTLGSFPPIYPFPIAPDGQNVQTPGLYSPNDVFYANYKMKQYHAASLQLVINLNNIRFHKPANRWSFNAIVGIGANTYRTYYDALDGNGNIYNFSNVANGLSAADLGDRNTIRDNIKGIVDGDYETAAVINKNNLITFGKDNKKYSLTAYVTAGLSIEYLITPRISIALEHQAHFSGDDYLDGYTRKEDGSLTSNSDIPHYTSLRLGIHLGSKSKRIQPLWFVNPIASPMQEIADLKKKLDDDWFKDDDNDGVPNKLDQERNTEPGAIVNTKGQTIDSDKDGIPDHLDAEPFSPTGYPVNESGIAQVPKPIYPEDVRIADNGSKLIIGNEVFEPGCNPACAGTAGGGMGSWYLPMIHFNLDKYALRPDAYTQLKHVADVMKKNPNMKMVVHGHTDSRASNDYNDMLSYNRAMSAIDYLNSHYGLAKDRFVVRYNGKHNTLIGTAKNEEEHFMNRRVEFYVSDGTEKSQERPALPKGTSNSKWKY